MGKLKDKLVNFRLRAKAKKWAKSWQGEVRAAQPPPGYQLVFNDDFSQGLNRENWRLTPVWGDFHADNLTMYYDTTGDMSPTTEQGLQLWIRNQPKSWERDQLPLWRQRASMPPIITIPVGIGMIHSQQSWQGGWFEAWIRLPQGQPYWTAFWMSGDKSWPPEIDIFEAYSHIGDQYHDKTLFGKKRPNRKIQPNLHWGRVVDGTKDQWGANDVEVAECTERLVQYACLWERDRIEIYYDGIKVFQCTDSKILQWYNNQTSSQNIIIGHGYHKDYAHIIPNENYMLVREVKVYQK